MGSHVTRARPGVSPLRVQLSLYFVAALFAIPYGALNSLNQNTQAVFGGEPGAAASAVARSDDLARLANVLISITWLVSLFFVPAAIAGLRGARNAFAVMMFAWAGAGAALVGAYAQTTSASSGASGGLYACGVLFALLVGVFGGLGYTATEVYLDACAEWMPLALHPPPAAGAAAAAAAAGGKPDGQPPPDDAAAAGDKPPEGGLPPGHDADDADAAAEEALRHKFIASKYKNMFASHMYAIAEVGTVAFALPGALGATDGKAMLGFLIAVTACLFAGALASLLVPDIHEPPPAGAKGDDSGDGGDEQRAAPGCCVALGRVAVAAAQSAARSVTCLSAYSWLAALAIVPYFLSAAWADNYFQFVISGTKCGLQSKPDGIGIEGVNVMALVGSAVQAAAAFAGPAMVGPRRGQFREHVWPLALGNACGAGGALIVVGLGGLGPRLCGSLGAMLAAKALASIAYGINNSVGVAAVLCWYDGPYQHLVVSALASRSVWYQLGGVIGPYTFSDEFAVKSGGTAAAWFAAAVYLAGSVCVVAADQINSALVRRRAAAARRDLEAAARAPSAAALRLEAGRGRMTAGFLKLD